MSNILTAPFANLFNRLVGPTEEMIPFNLGKLENFPFSDWTQMQSFYNDYICWFDGVPLREQIADRKTGQSTDKFPIKLNPIPDTCEKHAAVLLGNTLESIREGGVPVQFVPTSDTTPADAEELKTALKKAFEYAGGGAMFADAGLTSQYMGGCVWKVHFDAKNQDYPVQVENIDSAEFFGIPKGKEALKGC